MGLYNLNVGGGSVCRGGVGGGRNVGKKVSEQPIKTIKFFQLF